MSNTTKREKSQALPLVEESVRRQMVLLLAARGGKRLTREERALLARYYAALEAKYEIGNVA